MTSPGPSRIPEKFLSDVNALPPLLRALLDAELAAGNEISAVTHSHPAPPVGACIMLARPVSTRARVTGEGLKFRAINGSLYSAQFTDEKEFFFILEPPIGAAEEPDMDAIRNAANRPRSNTVITFGSSVVDKFRAGMHIDYEKWHDGIGYDLEPLANASAHDLDMIVSFLVPPGGWRDVEALASIATEKALAALRKALKSSNAEVRAAVTSYAPWIATDDERTELLLRAIKHGTFYQDLTSALLQVESFHPSAIVDALFRGLLVRPGDIAMHYAAMLAFIHGRATSAFDWDQRDFFMRFNEDDGAKRRQAFVELCALIDVDAAQTVARAEAPEP